MNKHDRDNYNFLMALNSKQFDEWFMTIDDDDIQYAMELFRMARIEIAAQLATLIDDVVEFSEARQVLDKFTLTGLK